MVWKRQKEISCQQLSSQAESKSPHANSSITSIMQWHFKGIYTISENSAQRLGDSSRIYILCRFTVFKAKTPCETRRKPFPPSSAGSLPAQSVVTARGSSRLQIWRKAVVTVIYNVG